MGVLWAEARRVAMILGRNGMPGTAPRHRFWASVAIKDAGFAPCIPAAPLAAVRPWARHPTCLCLGFLREKEDAATTYRMALCWVNEGTREF